MIFGRRKRAATGTLDQPDGVLAEEEGATVEAEAETPAETTTADDALARAEKQASEWDAAFDREEGPFDVEEVDLEADADEVTRIDFGSLIVTPFEGMTMQLQMNRQTEAVQAILVGDGESALELSVFAGPARTSLAPEVRSDIIAATARQKGRVQVAEGPFGAELRRMLPVSDAEGKQGMHVSRTWLVSGPGWMLRGVLLGRATFEPDNKEAQLALFEFFSNLVVRRGTAPAVPGSALPMRVPEAKA